MANIYNFNAVTDNHSTGKVLPENITKTFEETQTEILTGAFYAAKLMLMNEKEVMSEAVMGAVDVLIAAELNPDRFSILGFPPYGFSLGENHVPKVITLYNGFDTYLSVYIAYMEEEDPETHLPLLEISYGLRRETDKGTLLYDFDNYIWTKA